MSGRLLWLNLCWIWIVVLAVYLIWGGITQTGLYYWVGTLEIDNFGMYDPTLIGFTPGLLLGLPALVVLGAEARRQRRMPFDPVAAVRGRRQVGYGMGALGIAALAGALACFIIAQWVPDVGGPSVPFDAATLGNGPPPANMVSLTGTLDQSARASYVEGSRSHSWVVTFTGFRAAGEADRSGPMRFFVEHHVPNTHGWNVPYEGTEEDGLLIENDLPPLIRYMLEHQGVRIATPYYLLRTTGGEMRTPYYVWAGLGVFLGFFLLLGAALLLFMPWRGPREGGRFGR